MSVLRDNMANEKDDLGNRAGDRDPSREGDKEEGARGRGRRRLEK